MTEIEQIAAEQLVWWMRQGVPAKACLIALGSHYRAGWSQVYDELVRHTVRMRSATPT